MAEYIEREAAMQAFLAEKPDAHYPGWYAGLLEELPAADVAPVVHGRWVDNGIPGSMLNGCSVCGFTCGAYSFFYWPHCGARMDGESNGKAD